MDLQREPLHQGGEVLSNIEASGAANHNHPSSPPRGVHTFSDRQERLKASEQLPCGWSVQRVEGDRLCERSRYLVTLTRSQRLETAHNGTGVLTRLFCVRLAFQRARSTSGVPSTRPRPHRSYGMRLEPIKLT